MRLKFLPVLLYALLALGVVLLVYAVFLLSFQNIPRSTLEGMIYGQADKPFVYRALAPAVVRLIVAVVPAPLHASFNMAAAQNALVQQVFPTLDWSTHYVLEYLVTLALMFVLLVALLPAVAYLIRSVCRASAGFTAAAALFTVLVLLPFMGTLYSNYIYDFPTLILFTLGLALIARGRWRLYFLVFVLACINKETALLLTLVYAIHRRSDWRTRQFWLFLIAQGIVYGLIKGGLTVIFNANPGVVSEFNLNHNLELVRRITPVAIVILLGLAALIFYRWREKPPFLKQALWMIVPLFGFGLLFGYLDEIRIFYEVYPVVMLLIAHSAARLFRVRVTAIPERRTSPDRTSRYPSGQGSAASYRAE